MPGLTTDDVYMINEIAVKIKKNNRSKYLRLKFDLIQKSPVLIIPSSCSKQRIHSFLEESRTTIIEQFKDFFRPAETSSNIPFKGIPHKLETNDAFRKNIIINDDNKTILVPACPLSQKSIMRKVFKQQALHYFKTTCHGFAHDIGATLKSVKVRDYKSRWGCCAVDGTITLSWRLIMAPTNVIDYVCAHETAHLLHFNHSKEFWKTVKAIAPDYKAAHQWLRTNGHQLYNHL